MPEITLEHNPSEQRLKELNVASWPIWEKEVSDSPLILTKLKPLTYWLARF
jgi:uncharacterized protein